MDRNLQMLHLVHQGDMAAVIKLVTEHGPDTLYLILTDRVCLSKPEVVKALLELGVDVNNMLQRGVQPAYFCWFVKAPTIKTLQVILDHGADLRCTSVLGETIYVHLLRSAFDYWDGGNTHELILRKVLFLWRAGVDIHRRENGGRCAIDFAVSCGYSWSLGPLRRVHNRDVVFHFCGSKVFVLPDEFLQLLSGIF